MGLKRRDLLRLLGLGGVGGLGWLGRGSLAAQEPPTYVRPEGRVTPAGTSPYHSMTEAPLHLGPHALDAQCLPPLPGRSSGAPRDVTITVVERTMEVGHGTFVEVFAYDGTVPGPIIRVTEGEEVHVNLVNGISRPHSIHFHGSYDANQDGWQPVPPGERRTYCIKAECPGLHPYHCHTPPYAWHFSKGMYGLMIVDPPHGRPPAHEFVLALCGWDVDGDGRNELYGWNGVAGFYRRCPIKVPVGELVRLYIANLVEYDPVASFHLHAQTFDVFRSGTSTEPHEHTDVVTLGQTERAIIEFRLPRRGRYMFHPHQIHMAEKGAMGWIVAV